MENKSDRKGAIQKLKLLTFGSKSNVDAFRAKLDEGFKTVFLPNGVERTEYKYGNGDSIEFVSPEFCSLTLGPEEWGIISSETGLKLNWTCDGHPTVIYVNHKLP